MGQSPFGESIALVGLEIKWLATLVLQGQRGRTSTISSTPNFDIRFGTRFFGLRIKKEVAIHLQYLIWFLTCWNVFDYRDKIFENWFEPYV